MILVQRTVKLRRSLNDKPLKPDMAELNGKTFAMYRGWECGPRERYPGEYAWIFHAMPSEFPFAWISSGDLVPLGV